MPESVWDYPRPPRLETSTRRIRVVHTGVTIADTVRALRLLETSHPPGWYIPPQDVHLELLSKSSRTSHCEYKGSASYWDLDVDGQQVVDAAWTYAAPTAAYASITDHFAFYPGRVDACFVDEEQVVAQAGDFYGGWITSDVVGPFKGAPGTWGW
jgi:uncharacterized protein (DUF427 family)